MCPLGIIWPKIFKWQPSAFTKILGRRDTSIAPLVSTGSNKNAHSIYGGDCDAAIAKAAAAVTHVLSQSQEAGFGDEVLSLLCSGLSSAETNFWWLEDEL